MSKASVQRMGEYLIDGQIGSGGMGVVYRAKQISMRRPVALKVLRSNLSEDEAYRERFLHEVRLMASMEHPNMVRVYEGNVDKGMAYFSMELVEGADLKRMTDAGHKFTEGEAVDITLQVASALNYAWKKYKMIHRDVKPANVMRMVDGTVKLLDFGISRKADGNSADTFLTDTGQLIGSPTYISPEQARDSACVDCRSDIYSCGVSLYYILAGRPPYEGKSAVDVIAQHFSAPVPDIRTVRPDISRFFARALMKMMAKDAGERYQDWGELIAALEHFRDRTGIGRRTLFDRLSAMYVRHARAVLLSVIGFLVVMLALTCIAYGLMKSRQVKRAETDLQGNPEAQVVAEGQESAEASVAHPVPEVKRKVTYLDVRKSLLGELKNASSYYWRERKFAEGVAYFRDLKLPSSMAEGGEFSKDFKDDRDLHNYIQKQVRDFENAQLTQSQSADD